MMRRFSGGLLAFGPPATPAVQAMPPRVESRCERAPRPDRPWPLYRPGSRPAHRDDAGAGSRLGPWLPRQPRQGAAGAVIGHALPDAEGRTALSFRELIEVRFVRHFLRAGVSWPNIRRAAAAARRDLLSESGHRRRFSTDGMTIFADTLAGGGTGPHWTWWRTSTSCCTC